MKNGNWMPIDTRLAVFLPKDREYTELEAMYSLQLNYDRGTTVTVAGLAASWQWKRHAVYALLKKVGALVVYQGKRKSRSTGGIIVPVKGACQAHVGDMSCACRAHVRLIKNNKLDDKRSISVASQPHDNNMWASLLSIPQITYSYKDKEGGKNDRPGNNNHAPLSRPNGYGYSQHMQDHSKEDGNGDNPFPVVNGSGSDNGNQPTCEANLNGGLLNGSDMAISGPGINADIRNDLRNTGVGSGGTVDGLDGQEAMGKGGAQVDREGEVGHGVVGLGDNRDNSNSSGEDNGNEFPGANRVIDSGNIHTDKAGDNGVDGGVSHDILGAETKDEAKPKPEKKKPKKKNGIVLDLSTLDHGIDTAIVEEFIAHRNRHKSQKGPFTQRMLDGVIRNAKKVSETHGGTINDALVYAMENGWLTPDPKYIDDNKARFMAFLDEQHGPLSTDKEIQKKSEDLKRRAQIAQEKWERKHGAVDA